MSKSAITRVSEKVCKWTAIESILLRLRCSGKADHEHEKAA
jgi:hypothetical protein